ncbi:hypothetical protein F7734_19315 [Scytonema sp. UIC 10036]|uniref:hypothetical protein n=1 Tax=Scytonema sp. UIC 10036 TaxID=2304196 RepID=UPI0012DA4145|nr:hypothetical protein [Scytonema sp. UIC 10036]MUG94406.1 hypothetical protein [Scytonema sp. UIC 10036]
MSGIYIFTLNANYFLTLPLLLFYYGDYLKIEKLYLSIGSCDRSQNLQNQSIINLRSWKIDDSLLFQASPRK